MKNMIYFFMMLNLTLAQAYPGRPVSVNPRISYFTNQVWIDIYNHTQVDIDCRGSVHIRTERSSQTEYFNETIYRLSSRNRTYYLRDFRERVNYAYHSINCYER
jgi:hypothetical protein